MTSSSLGMVEVYGSWNKVAPRLEANQTCDIAEQLAEAIADHTLSAASKPHITMATGGNNKITKTGFQTTSPL